MALCQHYGAHCLGHFIRAPHSAQLQATPVPRIMRKKRSPGYRRAQVVFTIRFSRLVHPAARQKRSEYTFQARRPLQTTNAKTGWIGWFRFKTRSPQRNTLQKSYPQLLSTSDDRLAVGSARHLDLRSQCRPCHGSCEHLSKGFPSSLHCAQSGQTR